MIGIEGLRIRVNSKAPPEIDWRTHAGSTDLLRVFSSPGKAHGTSLRMKQTRASERTGADERLPTVYVEESFTSIFVFVVWSCKYRRFSLTT